MTIPTPVFNITVNIWRYGNVNTNPPDVVVQGNLAWGKRTDNASANADFSPMMVLLVPWDTDIRGDWNTDGLWDYVEVANGDGWWYKVLYVDRAGHSFPNKHLNAVIRLFRGNMPPASGDMPPVAAASCAEATPIEYWSGGATLHIPPGAGSRWVRIDTAVLTERHIALTATDAVGGLMTVYNGNDCPSKVFASNQPADAAWCFSWTPPMSTLYWFIQIPQDPVATRTYTFEVADGPCGGGGGGDTMVTESGDTLVTESGDTLTT